MNRPIRSATRTALAGGACILACLTLAASQAAHASVNSYRFLHVTIDTPWYIFLFLLMGIFAPFVLMVVLMWRNSLRRRDQRRSRESGDPPQS
jgi:hypothetical protein